MAELVRRPAIIRAEPTEDPRTFQTRVNDALRRLEQLIHQRSSLVSDEPKELTGVVDPANDYLLLTDANGAEGGLPENVKVKPERFSGYQPFAVLYSSGQYAGTSETALTSFDYTFRAGDLKQGDVLHLWGRFVLGGTTAGTKAANLYIGNSSVIALLSTTTTTNNTLLTFDVWCFIRNTTNVAVEGFSYWAANTAAPTFYMVNSGKTINSVETNPTLFRITASHSGASNELRLTDYFIHLFRGGSQWKVV